jgi:hypothetical protein
MFDHSTLKIPYFPIELCRDRFAISLSNLISNDLMHFKDHRSLFLIPAQVLIVTFIPPEIIDQSEATHIFRRIKRIVRLIRVVGCFCDSNSLITSVSN